MGYLKDIKPHPNDKFVFDKFVDDILEDEEKRRKKSESIQKQEKTLLRKHLDSKTDKINNKIVWRRK